MRVIHIVENLGLGAVETWLVRMLRHARRRAQPLDWTFYCAVGESGSLDIEAKMLGARVIYSPVSLGRKIEFVRALNRELAVGKYDVLHCHHDLVSAVYLIASAGLNISRRIVHVHNADENIPTPSRLKQAVLREPMRQVCLKMADHIVGISNHTLDRFLHGRTRRPGRDLVHYYGVDPAPFTLRNDHRASFRADIGVAIDAPLLLFGGRIVPEKNPLFVVDVLAKLKNPVPNAVGVFAGSGSLEEAVRIRANQLRVESSIRMLGWRNDLPVVMSACDLFILARPEKPMEGFGLAVVEAQLAGLRLLLSNGIPDDPLLPSAVFRRLSLAAGPQVWAESAMELLQEQPPSSKLTMAELSQSPMNMDYALAHLLEIYK